MLWDSSRFLEMLQNSLGCFKILGDSLECCSPMLRMRMRILPNGIWRSSEETKQWKMKDGGFFEDSSAFHRSSSPWRCHNFQGSSTQASVQHPFSHSKRILQGSLPKELLTFLRSNILPVHSARNLHLHLPPPITNPLPLHMKNDPTRILPGFSRHQTLTRHLDAHLKLEIEKRITKKNNNNKGNL